MKVKRRHVTDAIANLPKGKKLPREIRENAMAHSKKIAKLFNAGNTINNSPEVHRVLRAILPGRSGARPAKRREIRAAVRLIEKIAAKLHAERMVDLSAAVVSEALAPDDVPTTPRRAGEDTLDDYFDKHFNFYEQYLECRFNHDGREYSLELTDESDDYLRFHLYSGALGSRSMSECYDVGRHIRELGYSQSIADNRLKAVFRNKKSDEPMFSITLTPDARGGFAARADLSISEKLLKNTQQRFTGKDLGCSIEFID